MSHSDRNAIERILKEKLAFERYFTTKIQDAAGSTEIRRVPVDRPNWPDRKDYINRADFRRACAEWRRS